MARICIDGFNLALPNGSGIATYARNLNANLAAMGHDTQILFSSTREPGANNLLNQVAMLDLIAGDRGPGFLGRAGRLLPPLRPVARKIDMTGEVIADEVSARFPACSRTWAARDTFHSANAAFAAYRRFTPVRLGSQVETDVMHWTSPLPMREPRIANAYTFHDLVPLRLPHTTLDVKRSYYEMCKGIAARADRIFTVSEHSRADII